MEIIKGVRDSGKTKRLMEYAKVEDAIVCCYNPYAKSQKAKEYGIVGLTFINFKEMFIRMTERRNEKYVIDDLDRLLSQANVIGYSTEEI